MWPLGRNGTIDNSSVLDDHTYQVNPGKSMIHITNGQAGNIESHSILGGNPIANTTAYLDFLNYGSSRLTVHNETHSSWQFIRGGNQTVGDYLYIVKPPSTSNSKRSSSWDRLKKTAKRFVTESSKTRDLGSL